MLVVEYPIILDPHSLKSYVGRNEDALLLYTERYVERALFTGKKVIIINPPPRGKFFVKQAKAQTIREVFSIIHRLIKADEKPDIVMICQIEKLDQGKNYFDIVKQYRSLQFIVDKGIQVLVFGQDINGDEVPVISTSLCIGMSDSVYKLSRATDIKRPGRIYVRTGPMGANKTAGLFELYHNALDLGCKPYVAKPLKDTRSDQIRDRHGNVVPHDSRPDSLLELIDIIKTHHKNRSPFIVDESQFLDYDDKIDEKPRPSQRRSLLINQTRILEFCRKINILLKKNIKIFFYCLDMDFERKAWLTSSMLIGKSFKTTKQVAACEWCFNDGAHHSKQIVSGLKGAYQPGELFRACCRHCFHKKSPPLNIKTKKLSFSQSIEKKDTLKPKQKVNMVLL